MTEQINDQISAFIDDELSAEESALLVRRFERDPNARAQVLRYTMIGAALRGEVLEPHSSALRRRIAAALDGAVPAAERPAPRWSARYARPLLGFGIAAAVAVAAIGTLRLVNEAGVGAEQRQPVARSWRATRSSRRAMSCRRMPRRPVRSRRRFGSRTT